MSRCSVSYEDPFTKVKTNKLRKSANMADKGLSIVFLLRLAIWLQHDSALRSLRPVRRSRNAAGLDGHGHALRRCCCACGDVGKARSGLYIISTGGAPR